MDKSLYLRLPLILFALALVVALLLGAVHAVTEARISEAERQEMADACSRVLKADGYDSIEFTGDGTVSAVLAARTGGAAVGWVVEVAPTGSQGVIDMVVGINPEGKVTGIVIVSDSETPGLGSKAKTEPWFLEQFVGKSGGLAIGRDISAVSGATVTSKAVADGVGSALKAVAALG